MIQTTAVHATEDAIVATLIQLIVIVLAARVAGSAARAVRQPRAVGEIVAGLLLGPSFLGAFFPDASSQVFANAAAPAMQILSQIGLILLMFQIGSTFEFGLLRNGRNKKAVLFVTLASIGAPLATGLLIGWLTSPFLTDG
ncbi:MAG TPA: cation:proton antiporter, partial [Steroidobacteraceae bacterium]|nr:cation:proton antiporter [Steroidobacteraceae bacterium]